MARQSTYSTTPDTVKHELHGRVAAVCHDAGAANHVIAWLRSYGDASTVRPVMTGPAGRLWQRAFPNVALYPSIEDAIRSADFVLTGTGWGSDLEHEARKIARESGIRSAAALDHWVNYLPRFKRGETVVWPDEFWVVDEYARRIAQETFPGAIVRKQPNAYLSEQVAAIELPSGNNLAILYVLEPVRSDWGRGVPGEFQALDYFLSRLECTGLPPEVSILLRLHPSEPPGKYTGWIAQQTERRIQIDDSISLAQAISRARWVAGCESFALTVALAAGRPVFCSLPPWAPQCRLPHGGLVHVKDLPGGGTRGEVWCLK